MKYLILAITAMGLFSCTGQKTANNSGTQTRNVASYRAMGISDADADVMQTEINTSSSKGSTTFAQMARVYSAQLADFAAIAKSEKFSAAEKKAVLLQKTNFAERNIKRQVGTGLTYSILMKGVNSSRDSINAGDFSGALGIASQAASLFAGGN